VSQHIILNGHYHINHGIILHPYFFYRTHIYPGIPNIIPQLETVNIIEYRNNFRGISKDILLFANIIQGSNQKYSADKNK